MKNKYIVILIIVICAFESSKAQGLLTKKQGEYFYGFINSLPKNYGSNQEFANKVKSIHQKAFIYFEFNKKIENISDDNVYFIYEDGEKKGEEVNLKSNIFSEIGKEGAFTSCLVYTGNNDAYIVSYAKSYLKDEAIAIIWELQDGSVTKMQQGIVSMTRYSNNDNLVHHKFFFGKNMYFITEYTDLKLFILEDYEGVFSIK